MQTLDLVAREILQESLANTR